MIYIQESPKSITTLAKHNCASLCTVAKNKLQRLDLPMRHWHKLKTVFFCPLLLEKIRAHRTYVHKTAFTLIYILIYDLCHLNVYRLLVIKT